MDFVQEISHDCKDKKIYCYGAGNYGKLFSYMLKEINLNFSGFIVSSDSKEASQYVKSVLGNPVFVLDEFINSKDSVIFICLNKSYQDEVIKNLKKRNIFNYKLIDEAVFGEIEKTMKFSSEGSSDKNINILLYHRIMCIKEDKWNLAISPAMFEKQICYLKDNYKILRFEDDWTNQKGKCIVITFDDGYADNYLNALPILEKYEVPATFFVATDNINTNSYYWWDEINELVVQNKNNVNRIEFEDKVFNIQTEIEKNDFIDYIRNIILERNVDEKKIILEYLRSVCGELGAADMYSKSINLDQIRKMSKSNVVTIGAHTKTHHRLSSLSYQEQYKEILESKMKLEEITQKKVEVFSYPFGCYRDFNEDTVKAVKASGFLKAAAVNGGLFKCGDDEYTIPRNTIKGGTDLELLIIQLNRHWSEY